MGWRGAMHDACQVGTATGPANGEPVPPSFSYAAAIRCRYSRMATNEVMDGSHAAMSDVEIRVPRGTSVTSASRLRLTKLNRTTLSPAQDYAVMGEPEETLAEIVCKCTRVPGASAL